MECLALFLGIILGAVLIGLVLEKQTRDILAFHREANRQSIAQANKGLDFWAERHKEVQQLEKVVAQLQWENGALIVERDELKAKLEAQPSGELFPGGKGVEF